MEINFKNFIKDIKEVENIECIIDKYKEKYFEIELLNLEILDNCICIYENGNFCSFLDILGAKIINYTEKFVRIVTNDGSIYIAEYKKCSNGNKVLVDFGTAKEVTRKNTLYIITNRTEDIEYTPTVVKTRKEAIDWMRECTANNIALKFRKECVKKDAEIKEIIIWAERNISGFSISENRSFLPYDDTSWQEMNIYKYQKHLSKKKGK